MKQTLQLYPHETYLPTDSQLPKSGPIPYPLTNDYMFRAVIQKDLESAKHLVAALLNLDPKKILDFKILNPIILGDHIDEKDCILDIRLLLNDNTKINLEMQVDHLENWTSRSIYYLSRMFTDLKKGQDYSEVLPSLHIGILTNSLFPEEPRFYSKNYLSDIETHHLYSGIFGIHVLDLSQINNVTDEERNSPLYDWACLFHATTWEEGNIMAEKSDAIHSCANYLKELTEDEKIKLRCEARARYYADKKSAIETGFHAGTASTLKLFQLLQEQNRLDDFERCTKDSAFFQQLLTEFHLTR